jgi:hypothetical protein
LGGKSDKKDKTLKPSSSKYVRTSPMLNAYYISQSFQQKSRVFVFVCSDASSKQDQLDMMRGLTGGTKLARSTTGAGMALSPTNSSSSNNNNAAAKAINNNVYVCRLHFRSRFRSRSALSVPHCLTIFCSVVRCCPRVCVSVV